ncbi:hypothetical protein B7C42_00232 [Nocardia cerradoensis]|uniref:Uncharacterized protein n=1 Tax=Nocardia cerradoensis TaxID=85688 RepID=A0A231HDU8_9NOCA|nr:hypothetical protein [Nocardia cerradoensis]OXR47110.1 hypothetical protein B7C42_00232 [Nocardia cerradoensis]
MDKFEDAYHQLWSDLGGLPDAEADTCAGFWFQSDTSAGYYLPNGLTLSLAGDSEVEHHVTHLHEVYHKSLNDSTAWGTAMHLAYEYEPWSQELFGDLRHAAFTTHEVFATFKSINLAEMHYPAASSVLTVGSRYERYYRRARAFVQSVDSAIRQDLLVTAAARVSMQTPILEVARASFPKGFELSAVTNIDRPDGRFIWLLANMAPAVSAISQQADDAVAARFGEDVIHGHAMDRGVEDPEVDDVWDAWEQVVYDEFARQLTQQGATVLPMHDHSETAAHIVGSFPDPGPASLVVAPPDAPPSTDYDESVAILSKTRFPFRKELWPSSFGYMKGAIDPDDFMSVLTQVASVNGVPELVFHARLAGRLTDGYTWDDRTRQQLDALGDEIVVSVKCRTNIGDTDELEIFHVAFKDATDVLEIVEAWGGQGPRAFCISASCFVDSDFAARWVDPLRAKLPIILLLDVPTRVLAGEAEALLPGNQPAYGVYWGLTGTPYKALVWHVDGQPHVGIYIGDSLATQLMYGQFEDIMGENFSMDDADWSEWETTIAAVIRSITYCESFVDLRALESLRKTGKQIDQP